MEQLCHHHMRFLADVCFVVRRNLDDVQSEGWLNMQTTNVISRSGGEKRGSNLNMLVKGTRLVGLSVRMEIRMPSSATSEVAGHSPKLHRPDSQCVTVREKGRP